MKAAHQSPVRPVCAPPCPFLVGTLLLTACGGQFDSELLKGPSDAAIGSLDGGGTRDSGQFDAAPPVRDGGGTPTASTDASFADGGIACGAGNALDGVCTPCAEHCNGIDDDCDGEVDEDADDECSAANAIALCADGACLIASCTTDHRDCDGISENGCEVSIAEEADNCGGCRNQCVLDNTAEASCGDGYQCSVVTCNEGYRSCDGDDANGCETLARTADDCGGCGGDDAQPCTGLDNVASTDCTTGICRITACESGFQDCDGTADNGCEEPVGPNTCGCDGSNRDTDSDGTPDCTDECDNDPDKALAGGCGCGLPETDSDGDTTPDCIDLCDDDPDKAEPGQCGCDVADTDGDGDGTADCLDGCPSDPTIQGDCFPFAHSSFDSDPIDFSSQPAGTLDCGTTVIDSTDPDGSGPLVATLTNWCGPDPTPIAQPQTSGEGPEVVVIPLSSLTVGSSATLELVGSRPVVFATTGDITVEGTITADATGMTRGAGGNLSCTPAPQNGAGSNGSGSSGGGGGGGGGGGFGTAGGNGGDGDGNNNGVGGATRGSANLIPLLGGCPGGRGGGCTANGAAGGGALQLTAAGTLRVSGNVSANGGNGQTGCASEGGGTGGGSGGGILLEADVVNLSGGSLASNGGSGGNGRGGTSGAAGSTSPGSRGGTAANEGANGGGGGGGGYGRQRVTGHSSCTACP